MIRHGPFAAILLAVALVFGAAWNYPFVAWDDDLHFEANPGLNPVSLSGLRTFWTAPYDTPLTYALWASITRLAAAVEGGPAEARRFPAAFHRANLAAHAANALLAFALLRSLLRALARRGGLDVRERAIDGASAAGALFFALHPIQAEAVAWASGMRDLLCGLLSLGALCCFVSAAESRRPLPYAVSTLLFALALFAKPTAVALPFVALVLDAWVSRRGWRSSLAAVAPWFAAAAYFSFGGSGAQQVGEAGSPPLWARPLIAADTVAFYLEQILLPFGFAIDYGRSLRELSLRPWALASGAAPVALAALLLWQRRRLAWLGIAFLVFVAGLLPALGLVPYHFQLLSTVADRYAYLALLGPSFALACWLALRSRSSLAAAAGVLLLAMGALAARQTRSWESSEALFRQALRVNPRSVIGNAGMGNHWFEQGRTEDAIPYYEKALAIVPRYPAVLNRLGYVLLHQGRIDEAIAYLERALRDRPDWPEIHGNLADAWLAKGEIEKALSHLTRALELAPRETGVLERLGALHIARGEYAQAEARFRAALEIEPGLEGARRGLRIARERRASPPGVSELEGD